MSLLLLVRKHRNIIKYCNYILHFDNNVFIDNLVQVVSEHQISRQDRQDNHV